MRARTAVGLAIAAATVFVLALSARIDHGSNQRTRATMYLLAHTIGEFRLEHGRLPRELGELHAGEESARPLAAREAFRDRWRRGFGYEPSRDQDRFTLVALGRDGQRGGWFANQDQRLAFQVCATGPYRGMVRRYC